MGSYKVEEIPWPRFLSIQVTVGSVRLNHLGQLCHASRKICHVQALLRESSDRLEAARKEAEAKNAEILAELDMFRRAFMGDTLGWSESKDEQGKPYYINSETRE